MDEQVTAAQRAEELAELARAAWPAFEIPREDFVALLLERAEQDPSTLETLRAPDLYLAHACLCGDRKALATFESRYLGEVPRVLGRLRLTSEERDEVTQRLRQRLLVGTARGPARLSSYSGRGELRSWVYTAAIRVGQGFIDEARRSPADPLHEDSALESDLQLEYLRREYAEQFRAAFEDAVEHLSGDERNLLRFHFVDGMTADGLAAIYGVHRSTAARRVAAARDKLATLARRSVMANLGVGRADVHSIMRLIGSQLDVSVGRYLASRDPQEGS